MVSVREQKKERAQLMKDLKNAKRRAKRLKIKARELSTTDLVAVLVMRREEKAKRASRKARKDASGSAEGGMEEPDASESDEGAPGT